jgi:hypothetical protein
MVMGADHLPLMTTRGGRDGGAAAASAAAAEPLPHTTPSSWKDKTLKTGVARLELLRAVAPGCVDGRRCCAARVPRSASSMRATPSRAQRAQDGGCKVFTSWEDIVECKPKMTM